MYHFGCGNVLRRVAACKLLQQLLELPVDAVVVEPAMQQQPISDSGTQVGVSVGALVAGFLLGAAAPQPA